MAVIGELIQGVTKVTGATLLGTGALGTAVGVAPTAMTITALGGGTLLVSNEAYGAVKDINQTLKNHGVEVTNPKEISVDDRMAFDKITSVDASRFNVDPVDLGTNLSSGLSGFGSSRKNNGRELG